jgi:hypothetical protein
MSKNPPDKWARTFAVIGILIGASGLCLSFFNYRWQQETYEKNREERIFTLLDAGLLYSPASDQAIMKTEMAVEVVNFGMQPIYVKSVAVRFGERTTSFYEHDPMKHDPPQRLEPGESVNYSRAWLGGELADAVNKAKGNATVEVDTTRNHFSQPASFRVTVTDAKTLMFLTPGVQRSPHKK